MEPSPSSQAAPGTISGVAAATEPLIARRKLFGNPSRAQANISPDGRWLSWIAPDEGVLNVWVAPINEPAAARRITSDRKRGIQFHGWAYDNRHILYVEDRDGDENWHLYAVDVAGGDARNLTPKPGARASVASVSRDRPGTLLVGINDRDPRWHDLYEIDIADGAIRQVLRNDAELHSFVVDRAYKPRLAMRSLPGGGGAVMLRHDGAKFADALNIPYADVDGTGPMGMNRAGDAYFFRSSVGRDRTVLLRVDWASGRETVLAEHPKVDISGGLSDPVTGEVLVARANYLKPEWQVIAGGEAAKRDLDQLSKRLGTEFGITAQTADGRRWIIVGYDGAHPDTYYLFDRDQQTLSELFRSRPELTEMPLKPMRPAVIRARDGLEMVSYLTLPKEERAGGAPPPMVLSVHGGPWARGAYGFDEDHQWLANRGYSVLSVNFRGSTGFGKAFLNAGDHEWGREMHDDLLDGVAWAVREGAADPKRVAIMGASYGGYAALAGLAFTPEVFACGVAAVGPSNLETLLATIPPYWAAMYENFVRRIGDPRTEEGRALLRERSPLHKAQAIKKPLLIGQGANDPRVKQAESDQIVAAMKHNRLPVTYVLYPDEGHGFVRPENRLSWSAVVELFLATHLGGRMEPIGQDFEGSTLQVVEGAQHLAGLQAALPVSPGK